MEKIDTYVIGKMKKVSTVPFFFTGKKFDTLKQQCYNVHWEIFKSEKVSNFLQRRKNRKDNLNSTHHIQGPAVFHCISFKTYHNNWSTSWSGPSGWLQSLLYCTDLYLWVKHIKSMCKIANVGYKGTLFKITEIVYNLRNNKCLCTQTISK